jgi:hypothetical protein
LKKNSSKLTDEKSGKYSKHHEKEKQSIQLGDEIHAERSAILIESNVYKMWKLPQHPALFRELEGSLTFSHFLSYTMKHTHTSQKATMSRVGEGSLNTCLSTSPWGPIYRKD